MNQLLTIKHVLYTCVAMSMLVFLQACSGDARLLEEGVEAHNLQLQAIAIKAPNIAVDPTTGSEQKLFENTNQSIAFEIEARNTAGNLISVSGENRLWSVDNPAVATINENGVLQTHTAGSVRVGVSIGGIVAPDFELTVSDAALVGINSIVGDKAIDRCMPAAYTALGDFSDSTRVLKAVSWSIDSAELGSFTNVTEGQVSINAVNVGALELVATVGEFTGSRTIDINDNLNEVIIQNATVALEENEFIDLTAVGRYVIDGVEQLTDITSHVQWQVPAEQSVASVVGATGLLSGLEAGNTSVTASCGNLFSSPKSVVVLEAGSTGDSDQISFNESGSLELSLGNGAYTGLKVSTGATYSGTDDKTASTIWTVEQGNSVLISLNNDDLTITPVRLGESSIKATYEGITRSLSVEVIQ
jgi:hypothetical protein